MSPFMWATSWRYWAVILGLGLAVAWGHSSGRHGPLRELAELRAQQAQEREAEAERSRLAALAGARRLQEAQQLGDTLTLRVHELERAGEQRLKEKRDAIARTTVGRPCLAADALRVLDGAAGLRVEWPAARVPETAGSAAVAGGTAAAAASDRDLASWALAAGEQFERCRVRLGALIDWHTAPASRSQPDMRGPLP